MRPILSILLLAGLLLPGCAQHQTLETSTPSQTPSSEEASLPQPSHFNRTLMRSAPRPALQPPTFSTPLKLASASVVGVGPEPSILAAQDGRIYVTYLDSRIGLWRSDDGGATYQRLDGSQLEGPADAAIAEAGNGTLYWAGLGGEGSSVSPSVGLQASTDHGEHWSDRFDVSDGEASDRQWVDGFPNGTVLVTWTSGIEPGQQGSLMMRASADGKHWLPIQTILPAQVIVSGPPVHDPAAPESVHIPYFGGPDIRVVSSHDGGKTWKPSTVAANLAKGIVGHGGVTFPIAAVDQAGTVYVTWASPQHDTVSSIDNAASPMGIFLSRSLDGGKTWSWPKLVSTPGHTAIYPWVSAGAPGRIVLTWYENQHGINQLGPDLWDVVLVESVTADLDNATFLGGRLNKEPVHVGQICDLGLPCTAGDRSRGDFFANAIKPDGQPVVAWVSDSQTPGSVDVMVGGVAQGTPLR